MSPHLVATLLNIYVMMQYFKLVHVQQSNPMKGEKPTAHPLVTDELAEFEKKAVEVQDFRKITDPFRGVHRTFLHSTKKNRKMSTCNPVGRLGNTWILTDFAQKSPQTLIQSIANNEPVHLIAMWD